MPVSTREFHKFTLLSSIIIIAAIPFTVGSVRTPQTYQSKASSPQSNIVSLASPIKSPQIKNGQESSVVLYPIADATVYKTEKTTNSGNGSMLQLGGLKQAESFLTFDLPGYDWAFLKKAILRFKVATTQGTPIAISSVSTTWSEQLVTFDTKPTAIEVLSTATKVGDGIWIELDVTEHIKATTDMGVFSVGLTSPSSHLTEIFSKESTDAPRLLVTTQ